MEQKEELDKEAEDFDDLEDPREEERDLLTKLIEQTKEIVEEEETTNEKKIRLERTRAVVVEASDKIDHLSERMDSPTLTDKEKITIGEELLDVEIESLKREQEILEESFKVVSKRIEQRRLDSRQDLNQTLKMSFLST